MKQGLVLALLVLALVGALWLRNEVVEPEIAAPIEETRRAPAETSPALVRPPADESASGTRIPVQGAPSAAPTSTPESEASLAPGAKGITPIRLSGTVSVVDERGLEHRAEDGSLWLLSWSGNRAQGHDVEVRSGSWTTYLLTEGEVEALSVVGLELGDRATVCEAGPDERFPVPPSGWLELRARWPTETILHVRDRESGRELDPVLLAEVTRWPEADRGHPGPAGEEARDLGASPVAIPARSESWGSLGPRTLYARSPGYAWGRIEIDETRGGPRFLFLDPGGDLEVVLLGQTTDPGTELRLFGEAHRPAFESRPEPVVQIRHLPAGSYSVRVEIGDFWDDPLVLGEGTVEVLAGRQSTVTVQVQEPAPRIDVPFAGTLVVPTEWNLAEFTLGFDLLDVALGGWDGRFSIDRSGMRAEDDPPTTYRWHSPGAQPGRYSVQLRELTFTVEIEVGEGGLSDARIEVPSPAEVRVRCVDAGTGSDVTDGELSWNCVRQVGGTCNSARWDAELDRWTFRAPIGEIVLDPSVPGYDFQWQTVRVEPGINDFVLRLVRSTGLTPILMDGKDEIAWDDDAMLTLVAAEGQQDSLSSSSGGGRITLFKREPGLYRLKVPDIPGYEPVPEALVHLEKGVIQEYVIELRRSP